MLEDSISKAEQVIAEKFSIKIEQSKLVLHEDWDKFLVSRDHAPGYAESMFLPKDLTANLPKNIDFESSLPLALHELEGHGLYCEHTQLGKKLVEDEKKLIFLDSTEYPKFKESCLDSFKQIKPNVELAAIWVELFLLKELGKTEILKKREEKLKSAPVNGYTWYDVFQKLKEFEKEEGTYELWYKLGFPRRYDQNTIISIAKEKLGDKIDDLVFLILLGSRKEYSDIDLCAVLNGTDLKPYKMNLIDIAEHNLGDFTKKAENLDVLATEPLLTGKFIMGNEGEYWRVRSKVLQTLPNRNTVDYLINESLKHYERGIYFLGSHKKLKEANPRDGGRGIKFESKELDNATSFLSYAISYFEFAMDYDKGNKLLTLEEVKEKSSLLNSIRAYMHTSKMSEQNESEVTPLFGAYLQMLSSQGVNKDTFRGNYDFDNWLKDKRELHRVLIAKGENPHHPAWQMPFS